MPHIDEFSKGEIVELWARQKTTIVLNGGEKKRTVPRGYRIHECYYYGFDGWISCYSKPFERLENVDDWRAVATYPAHHASCLEYSRRLKLYLNDEITLEELRAIPIAEHQKTLFTSHKRRR